MKCNASKTTEGNLQKSLKCDNECARLERNRKLALALNIDPEAHKDDHVPYSTTTLQMFQESVKWAQSQEREFRVFAADSPEKRLRFKPMPPHQRAFLHALAEDFGFDSESMDPEPHRHVVAFKTPRFVMAPMKTLAECVRIRTSAAASEAATIADAQKKLHASNEPYNGFLFTTPRFGLTIEELRADLAPTLDSALGIAFVISFLPSEEIVVKAHPASSATSISTSAIEAALKTLKPALVSATASKTLAGSVSLCLLDPSLNILRREADSAAGGTATDGWSRVAAKAASGMRFAPRKEDVGGRNLYTVLGSKAREKKKREEEEEARRESVVEDWEEAVRLEEAEAKVEVEEEEAKAEEAESVELGPANGENKTWLETSEVAAVDTRS
ncbi:FKBP12-associated protein [Loxospora ochrophaea]|nr:FKBP12-associated protein [Loxospora ochrophaea]